MKCYCKCSRQQCNGIITDLVAKTMYHVLVIFTSTLLMIVIIILICKLVAKHNSKNGYSTMKLNHIISDVMMAFCLIILGCVDVNNVQLLQWRHSTVCFVLRSSSSILLGLSSFLKTSFLICVFF